MTTLRVFYFEARSALAISVCRSFFFPTFRRFWGRKSARDFRLRSTQTCADFCFQDFFFDFTILKINWQFKEFKSIKLLKCLLNLFAYSEFFKFYYSFFHFFRLSRLFKLSRYFRPFKLSYSSIFLDFSVFRFFKLPTFFKLFSNFECLEKLSGMEK